MSPPRFPTTPMCSGDLLEAFEPTTRATDVFCATTAKCGQTWLLTLMHHLRTQGRDPKLGGKGLIGVVPWLELPTDIGHAERPKFEPASRLAELEALPDPRVFKMHVLWEEIPRPPGSGAKVVTITRDPRDLPYSMYRHVEGMKADIRPEIPPDFDGYFERWFDNGYIFKFVAGFWPHRDDPDVLWLRYEDLQSDLRAEAWKLVDFLGWPLEEQGMDRVLPLVDFSHMQREERSGILGPISSWRDDARFFREGGVGKNRARLSADQEGRIVARARELWPDDAVDFIFSQGL